jgi:NAD(P)-dependent dehydrogenase (short-subunit alcohol dehydrogenase family)
MITGASGGIGRATAACIADQGGQFALLGRDPEKTRAISFLASQDASYITGASLAVDGGFTCQ